MKPGDPWPDDGGYAGDLSVAERLSLVWPLTVAAYAFAGERIADAPLQRHVVRIERREG